MRNLKQTFLTHACIPALLVVLMSACSTYKNRITDTIVSEGNYGEQNIEGRYLHLGTKHRSYEFLMKSGGIQVFEPNLQGDGTYFLPVLVDVSGNTQIMGNRAQYRPDLGVREVVLGHAVEDPNRLLLYVRTAAIGDDAPTSITRGLNIGNLEPGDYTIEYLNRNGSTVVMREFSIK